MRSAVIYNFVSINFIVKLTVLPILCSTPPSVSLYMFHSVSVDLKELGTIPTLNFVNVRTVKGLIAGQFIRKHIIVLHGALMTWINKTLNVIENPGPRDSTYPDLTVTEMTTLDDP